MNWAHIVHGLWYVISPHSMMAALHILWWLAMVTIIATVPLHSCLVNSRMVLKTEWALIQLLIGSMNLEEVVVFLLAFSIDMIINTKSTWPGCCEIYGDLRKFQEYIRWCYCHLYFLLKLCGGLHVSVHTPCATMNITILHEMGCNL